MSQYIEWSALGQVVVAGLVVGAGLPALFALGVRFAVDGGPGRLPGGWRRLVAGACFLVVLAAVAGGLALIVAGGH